MFADGDPWELNSRTNFVAVKEFWVDKRRKSSRTRRLGSRSQVLDQLNPSTRVSVASFYLTTPILFIMTALFSFQAYVYRGQGSPLGRSLEQVVGPMNQLSGLFFEWDGSLTWANQSEGWQIDGTVYDDGKQVQYVDLHGRIDRRDHVELLRDRLRELLSTWGALDELMLMRLPQRQWQNLQDFEKELLSATPSSSK